MALEFDGVSSRVVYPNIAATNGSNITFSCRFYLSEIPTELDQYYLGLFETGAGAELGLILWLRSSSLVEEGHSIAVTFLSSGTSKFVHTNKITWITNRWYALVITISATLNASETRIYIDGFEQDYFLQQDATGILRFLDGDFIIAGRASDNERNFNGRLADVGVWDTILSVPERAKYFSGLPPAETRSANLQFDVRYVNGDTTDAITSNSGTVIGIPVASSHPTDVVRGGQAMLLPVQASSVANNSPMSTNRSAFVVTTAPLLAQIAIANNVPPLAADIEIFDQYEGGNADMARTIVTSQETATPSITLYARPGVRTESDSGSESIFYTMAFCVTGIGNKTPIFRFNIDDSAPYSVYGSVGWPSDWRCWYSYDNESWQRMANSSVVGNFQEVSHSSAFTGDTVYLATRPPYTHSMMKAHTEAIKLNPLVSEPHSSAGNGYVFGQSVATTRDGDGWPVPALDLVSYRISNDMERPFDGTAKRRAVLIARQHASEDQGSWQLQAFVDFLLSGGEPANSLLRDWEFFVYPMVNVSGVWGNAHRGTLQEGRRDEDPNRDWPGGDTSGTLQVVTETRLAIAQDTGNVINAFMDFHGLLSDDDTLFRISSPVADNFAVNVNSHFPIKVNDSSSSSGLSESYYRSLGVRLAVTPEGDGIVQSVSDYRQFSEALAQGLNDSFVLGDFPATSVSCASLGTLPASSLNIENVLANTQRSFVSAFY